MADKYIIHGATYNGDGTTSSEAASDGAAGAWNTINYMTGTTPAYGTLGAGDRVFVRSKSSGGADITVNATASLSIGSSAGTETSPVTWIIDAGTIWSGVAGTLSFVTTGTSGRLVLLANNDFIAAATRNMVLGNAVTNMNSAAWLTLNKGRTFNLYADCSAVTTSGGGSVTVAGGIHSNFHFKQSIKSYGTMLISGNSFNATFINPTIEATVINTSFPVWRATYNYNGGCKIFGGEVVGAGAAEGVPVAGMNGNAGELLLYGFKWPAVMVLTNSAQMSSQHNTIVSNGCDGGLGNAYADYSGVIDSRDDGYYPKLNATLETSDDKSWTYKLYPYRATIHEPMQVTVSKFWQQAAAAKTITVEFLWPTTMAAPTKNAVFMTVSYTDSSGVKRFQATDVSSTEEVDTSLATWSTTTYGPTSFSKRRLALTTAYSIKQDTEVLITFATSVAASNSTQTPFLDPDPVFS